MKFYRRSGLLHLPCKRPAEDEASMFEVEFAETVVLTNPLAEEGLGVHVQNSYVRNFTARRRGLTLQGRFRCFRLSTSSVDLKICTNCIWRLGGAL